MDALRANLSKLSTALPELDNTPDFHSCPIALVGPNLLAVLAYPSKLYLLSLHHVRRSPASALVATIALPADETYTDLLPAEGMLAIHGPSSICILDCVSPSALSNPSPLRTVAAPLFAERPDLRVRSVAWSPAAPGFLMTLTSDCCLRLYDVLTAGNVDVERWRLRVVTPAAPPIAFAFGRGPGWDALSVYVLGEEGKIHVAAPIAPIGTRLAKNVWNGMRAEVRTVIERETVERLPKKDNTKAVGKPDPFGQLLGARTPQTARKLLDFSGEGEEEANGFAGDENDEDAGADYEESWALKQAHMQRRFLEHVFAPTADGDMVAVREFKPAPLLFQGPLYTEHEDLDDASHPVDASNESSFVSLKLLRCGANRPPVLLRATRGGDVSVLIGMENVEAQWFITSDPHSTSSEELLETNEDYAECARTVAPSLLCFEHFRFDMPVKLVPVGQKTDADALYAVTRYTVFSVRLSFISALADAATLESTPRSLVSQILSVWKPGLATDRPEEEHTVLGLTPFFARGEGPVALVLCSNGTLHASDPLTWMNDFEKVCPGSLLGPELDSEITWGNSRPFTGRAAFAFPDSGKEMMALLHRIQTLQGTNGGRVTAGTLGVVGNVYSQSSVLEYLKKRVEVCTGGLDGPGIGDSCSSLNTVLGDWSVDLQTRSRRHIDEVDKLQTAMSDIERSGIILQGKCLRVEEGNIMLRERIRVLMKEIQQGSSHLSPVERERYTKLKEKKHRLASLRNRISELESASQARKAPVWRDGEGVLSTPRQGFQSPYGTSITSNKLQSPSRSSTRSKRWSASPSWRSKGSPTIQRGAEFSPTSDQTDLTRGEVKAIKETLEKHSKDIGDAMDLSTKLWQRLSVQ